MDITTLITANGAILVHEKTGQPVQKGEIVESFRGERYRVTGGSAPHHAGSTGRVWLQREGVEPDKIGAIEFYPGVVGLKWEATSNA